MNGHVKFTAWNLTSFDRSYVNMKNILVRTIVSLLLLCHLVFPYSHFFIYLCAKPFFHFDDTFTKNSAKGNPCIHSIDGNNTQFIGFGMDHSGFSFPQIKKSSYFQFKNFKKVHSNLNQITLLMSLCI